MNITIIGMAGVGKTYYSSMLARDLDYTRIGCDDLIEITFSKELAHLGVQPNLKSITQWRGSPYEKRYKANERLQIANEQAVMESVCRELENTDKKNIVVDTAGSMVYIDSKVIQRLKNLTRFVYIKADKKHIDDLFTDEIILYRPLVWGDAFTQREGETNEDAMRRSFRDLIAWRSKQYEQWSDTTIDYASLRKSYKTAKQFLQLIEI